MARTIPLLLSLSLAAFGAQAQMTGPAVNQTQPAPIIRGNASQINTTEPTRGVWLRSDRNGSTRVVSATANTTEIRVEHGRANVQVYHPAEHAQITVDLPGGQIDLLKDGFYTFNADTNTVRVLRGEAASYTGSADKGKAIKVKEDHEYAFNGKPEQVPYQEIASDVLPGGGPGSRGEGYGYYGPTYGPGYAYGPYGDGYYDYPYAPYYAYGYPFGLGFGFGYYGGFRGGYYGGFRGRR
jgi:hypothetical protein